MADENQPLLPSEPIVLAQAAVENGPPAIDSYRLESAADTITGSFVTCRICQGQIDISDKRDQFVVKCDSCNEATPICHAPPGKKYVRCPCNCLLICRSTSQRILCPRPNCNRVINLTPSSQDLPAGMVHITCTHCRDIFLFSLTSCLARCPHCRKLSAVGNRFRQRGILFLVVGIIKILTGIILLSTVHSSAWLITSCTILFILAVLFLLRAVYCFTMPKSSPTSQAEQI